MDVSFFPARLAGTAAAPASKSEAHRRMICAGLTQGVTRLEGFMNSEDMEATRRCLAALGAELELQGETLLITGGARKPASLPVLDCGESGSTLRFFVPIALALTGGGVFRMHGRLGQRPMDIYRELFVPRGVDWYMGVGTDGSAELTVSGHLPSGDYVLPGNVSSQFVSGLLFALALLEGDSTLTVTPPVESIGYIRMTLQAIAESGVTLEQTAGTAWRIPGGQRYTASSRRLDGDWSQAAVLLCADALGADITVTGLRRDSTQGDIAVLEHLARLGAEAVWEEDSVRVAAAPLHGAVLDMRNCPDIAPILALVCQLAKGESRLTHCGRLRLKESDRLAATAQLLRSLGGDVHIDGDDLVLRGVDSLRGGTVDSKNDHRMVMLASIAGSIADGPVTVSGAEALGKSWPDYLRVYQSLGGNIE